MHVVASTTNTFKMILVQIAEISPTLIKLPQCSQRSSRDLVRSICLPRQLLLSVCMTVKFRKTLHMATAAQCTHAQKPVACKDWGVQLELRFPAYEVVALQSHSKVHRGRLNKAMDIA